MTFPRNISLFNESKILLLLLVLILGISMCGQYSAFNGELCSPIGKHALRIMLGIILMCAIACTDLKFWNNFAYFFYVFTFIALVIVEIRGAIRLGAQRWIDLYIFSLQPSELMKLALVLSLARYYSLFSLRDIDKLSTHMVPLLATIAPAILVMRQPDLGTALILLGTGFCVIFLEGFPLRILKIASIILALLLPCSWFLLHDYQRNRILTFLDPDRDPLGMGYHILQSKIAIGSGGLWGKGFLNGTQSKLDFLPEKNTDFIFTTITEEFGFMGGICIIILLISIVFYFLWIGRLSKVLFTKIMCYGLAILLFLHTCINIAMVIGLMPIVGIPLPFISYGGTSMITFMSSCGLIVASCRYGRNFNRKN